MTDYKQGRSQLIVGTFLLEDTELAVTPEQAGELLPLWQLLNALASSDISNQMETEAVISQIQETLTYEQMLAIRDMQLTDEDNQTLMKSLGITGLGSGEGGLGGGQGKNLTEEEKAARRAEKGISERG
jgi:hypothetical protein